MNWDVPVRGIPRLDTVCALAAALGVDVVYLVDPLRRQPLPAADPAR